MNLRGIIVRGCRLLGSKLVFGRRSFQLFELKLHLVEQARLALVAGPKTLAPELEKTAKFAPEKLVSHSPVELVFRKFPKP